MRDFVNTLLEIVYPHRCPGCDKRAKGLFCPRCSRLLPEIGEDSCAYCGKPTMDATDRCRGCRGRRLYFDSARAVWAFEGPARLAIHAFKYGNQKTLAVNLAALMAPLVPSDTDVISWVPLTRKKTWNRGYNQAKLLARAISREIGLPARELLARTRQTIDQNLLDFSGRKQNVRDAFRIKSPDRLTGLRVVLVDDVFTTGATVAECSRILKTGGARSVHVVTVARTVMG